MSNANAVLVRMPADLKRRLQALARRQGVSLNQLITYSLTRELTALEGLSYLEQRLEGRSPQKVRAAVDRVLRKANDREVPGWDRV